MATIRLIPSTWYNAASNYVTITDGSNAYTDTDSTTYAKAENTYASTSSRYIYLRGFNFGAIPSGATINSFTVKIKGYEYQAATSASYAPTLCNGTSAIASTTASSNFSTSTQTIEVPTGALTWQQITNYGSNFGIRINVRRSNKNRIADVYIYGAEIEVTYTVPSQSKIYIKENGSWVQYSKVYKKINGSWVEQSDPGSIFDTSANYVKEN